MGWENSSYFNCRETFYDQEKPPPSLGDEYQPQPKRYREPCSPRERNYSFHSFNKDEIHPVFNIKKSSSQEDFKQVYRKMILESHPDKPLGSHEEFIKIQAAYEELGFNTSE
tara:strand:+ start:483 stop:818 length:336 start_codon:yes stop_codon:yes gene_type:complete